MVERTLQERCRHRAPHQVKCSINLTTIGTVLIGIQLILFYFGFRLQQKQNNNNHHHETLLSESQQMADGTFNGYPVYYQNLTVPGPYTVLHCVGENYQNEKSWMHRSCHFSFFCFDVKTKEFQVYRQEEQENSMIPYVERRPYTDVTQSYIHIGHNNNKMINTSSVSLGGINLKWGGITQNNENNNDGDDGYNRLEWFPKILPKAPSSFYTLPSDVVLVPFHSLAGGNPGHLLWDDFLPIYTLLQMFQLPDRHPLLLRYVLPGPGLWASCDATDTKKIDCSHMLQKFWPLMTDNPNSTLTTQLEAELKVKSSSLLSSSSSLEPPKSNLVCARHGVAGIGSLTDHGTNKLHGWHERDYTITQNHGRGGMFWRFRQHAMQNIGLELEHNNPNHHKFAPPYKIVFSIQSSSNPLRNLDFTKQIRALNRYLNSSEVDVQTYVFKDYSLKVQLKIAKEASIFITGCGGGAVTATFLPKGSSVLIYYNEVGGRENNAPTNLPARLDWDLFNSLGYTRVHWLPSQTMNQMNDLQALLKLVQHELGVIKRDYS